MPHFCAKNLRELIYPVQCGDFCFVFEAWQISPQKEHSLILVECGKSRFFLTKQHMYGKYIVKYNKHTKCHSLSLIKAALKEYARLCAHEVLYSNLTSKNAEKTPPALSFVLSADSAHAMCEKHESIIIEIGFGSGRHLIDVAKKNPRSIIIGVEVYRPAVEQVLRHIARNNLHNIFIIQADCRSLFDVLPCGKIECIYVHFPVPWEKNPKKRVFSSQFLQQCSRILVHNGFVELRTDSKEYFDHVLHLAENSDFNIDVSNIQSDIISKYEARWRKQNKEIFHVRFYKTKHADFRAQSRDDFCLREISLERVLNATKHIEREYFLHIKHIYRFSAGFVLEIVCGDFGAPTQCYMLCGDGKVAEILGDVVPTSANVNAINLLMRNYGK